MVYKPPAETQRFQNLSHTSSVNSPVPIAGIQISSQLWLTQPSDRARKQIGLRTVINNYPLPVSHYKLTADRVLLCLRHTLCDSSVRSVCFIVPFSSSFPPSGYNECMFDSWAGTTWHCEAIICYFGPAGKLVTKLARAITIKML